MKYLLSVFIVTCCFSLNSCEKKKTVNDNHQSDTLSVNQIIRQSIPLLQKNPDSAVILLKRSLKESRSLKYSHGTGESYEFLGLANFYKFLYDTAKYYHHKAFDIFSDAGNKNGMALALVSLSYDYSVTNNLDQALDFAEKARTLYEQTHNFPGIYNSIEALVYLHRQLNHAGAVDSLLKELVIAAENTGDKKRIANSNYNLGNYYIEQAYVNLAIQALYKALKLAEESGDSIEIANALGSVGLANIYLQDYNKAISYYKMQEQILKKQNNLYELSITYTNLGEAYNSLHDYTTGLSFHQKSLRLRQGMNFNLALSSALHNVAYTYYLMNDSDEQSMLYVRKALAINEEIKNYPGFARNYMLIGNLELRNHQYDKGIKNLERSVEIAEKYGETNVIQEASDKLSAVYAQRNDYKNAFKNLIINNKISDSIISGKNVKKITQLEMQHEFDSKQNETELRHMQETLELETSLRRNRLIKMFSFVVAALITISGIVIYKSYLKSRKADKEKDALLREIHHRVKNNLMVISSLLNLQSGTITDDNTKSAMKESQSRVKSMALIHQLLYQSDKFSMIDFPKYLEQLMNSLQSTFCKSGTQIDFKLKAENIKIDIDTAIPLGLITNELATNAYKYAFTESNKGSITIDLFRIDENKCHLRISDNGKGLPENFDPENLNSLGIKLVRILTRQIKAKLDFSSNGGTEFNIIFPEHV